MGKTLEITCDGCGDDIAYTGNCVDYRLVLTSEAKAPWYAREGLEGGAVTAMYISRPISRDHTFCNYDPVLRAEEVACQAIEGSIYAVQTYLEDDWKSLAQYVHLRLIDPSDYRHLGVSVYVIRSIENYEKDIQEKALMLRKYLDDAAAAERGFHVTQ